ncbi:TPA: hypothetical protein ACKPZV_000187 [Stenotrophomonas maltophilia]
MDVEQRARELLAAEWKKQRDFGSPVSFATYMVEIIEKGDGDNAPDMRALVAALTPPEGYVLVPVDETIEKLRAMMDHSFGGHGFVVYGTAQSITEVERRMAPMLAAHPEVKND